MDAVITPSLPPSSNVLIYEYGCRVDKEAVPHVLDQIAQSRRLYNTLVACIRYIVEEMKSFVLDKAGPEARACQAEIESLNDAFAAAKANNFEADMKRIAETRRSKWKELGELVKGSRKAHKAEIQARFLSRIGKNTGCDTYQIRCQAVADGLGWATANAVLDNALQAFKSSSAKGMAPRFAVGAEKTQDTLTLQFTTAGGVSADTLLSESHGELAMEPTNGCGKRKYGNFRFRLGPASAGINATGTWQYHRPLPESASIGMARLVRRQIGKDTKWALQLMVKTDAPQNTQTGRQPLVAIHFGWNADIDGRRVAGICESADPGQAKILRLPPEVEAGLQRASYLQGERDQSRDKIVPRLSDISLPPVSDPDNPEEGLLARITEELAALRRLPVQHVALRRLHRFCAMLRDLERMPDWLEDWRKQDRLRWQSASHIATRARNLRKDFYRVTATNLARRYAAIAIEPLGLAKSAKKVDEVTGEKTGLARKARAGRTVAAIYEFESALRHAAAKNGAALFEVYAKTATHCGYCGGGMQVDEADSQLLHCTQCGAEVDRKQNGAARAWQAVSPDIECLVEDYWVAVLAAREEHAQKTMEKKGKMAAGRKAARTVKEVQNPGGSREPETASGRGI